MKIAGIKFLPWKDDHWNSHNGSILRYDKLEHFLLAFIGLLCTLLIVPKLVLLFGRTWVSFPFFWWALLFWILVAIVWEIKDGIKPYDGVHVEGFSWKDLLADFYGFLLAAIIYIPLA